MRIGWPGLTDFITDHGLPLMGLVIMIESFGVPLPGETALIAFGVLASQGHFSIAEVIAVAAIAAIIGDNLGYWLIGRLGGPKLFERWDWLGRYADRVLPRATELMKRHGGKTVFFGRFVSVLRYTVAWVAGITHMEWSRFLFWNAAGGIVWATSVGLLAYFGGHAAAEALTRFGVYAAAALALALLVFLLFRRRIEKKVEEKL
jgi:membrane protein DedA with SNARE-associated domain